MAELASLVMGMVSMIQAFQSATGEIRSLAPEHASLIKKYSLLMSVLTDCLTVVQASAETNTSQSTIQEAAIQCMRLGKEVAWRCATPKIAIFIRGVSEQRTSPSWSHTRVRCHHSKTQGHFG
jgi:hypothetical protein